MTKNPKFLLSLAPEHRESLKAERAEHIDREKSESYDVRAQRHFDIIEAGGDPHNEEHRHAFFLHSTIDEEQSAEQGTTE
jgi:hypothetical protein